MQGLNLMIDDSPQIIFVLGIDRQRVAAALAVKYEKVLPYFASSDARPSEKQTIDPNTGLEFAYGFIEKFVQVAFQVPRAKGQQFNEFPQHLQRPQNSETVRPTQLPFEEAPTEIREDTAEVSSIAGAPFLDYNPRRMKQFLNVFRLRRFIAYHHCQTFESVRRIGRRKEISQQILVGEATGIELGSGYGEGVGVALTEPYSYAPIDHPVLGRPSMSTLSSVPTRLSSVPTFTPL
jgi:hypothetical protein